LQVLGAKSEVTRYNAPVSKHYDQYCPLAHACGVVGERWTLLVARELLHGPKRYTDLLDGLPGIGTNVLASRLRDLERAGVVAKRKLPPPAASMVYELTEYGRELEEVLNALARWGARSLGPPGPEDEMYPEWGVNALPALFNPEAARGLTETYVLAIGDDVFTAQIENGHLHPLVGASEEYDLRVEMDMDTFFGLATGELSPLRAVEAGRARIEGDAAVLERCFTVLSLAPRDVAAATPAALRR
jgi:DNA-binding HxlR family transcriptional regulator/putative sterol carrier protein